MNTRSLLRLMPALLALGFQPAVVAAQDVGLDVDLFEVHLGEGDDHLLVDGDLTVGSGSDQFILRFDAGSETRTSFDDVELQAYYSRSLSEKVALHIGMRHDARSGPDLSHAAVGLKTEPFSGLEARHYFFVSQAGDLTSGAEFILGLDLTANLVLEPRMSIGWSAQEIPVEGLGNGFTDVDVSLRLRHALSEKFNVYTGVVHERLLGSSRDIAAAAGDPSGVTRAIIGLGFSF